MAQENRPSEPDYYLTEAMGAFAHEIRTPLTALHMAIDLAEQNKAPDGSLVLDEEIAGLVRQSLEAMERLVDELQETSRLQRGKGGAVTRHGALPAALDAARERLWPEVRLEGPAAPAVEGPWDAAKLGHALAGLAESANRIGDGCGAVRVETTVEADHVLVRLESGSPGDASKPVAADAGFGFFRARQSVLAMGGEVDVERGERFARLNVKLPADRR